MVVTIDGEQYTTEDAAVKREYEKTIKKQGTPEAYQPWAQSEFNKTGQRPEGWCLVVDRRAAGRGRLLTTPTSTVDTFAPKQWGT